MEEHVYVLRMGKKVELFRSWMDLHAWLRQNYATEPEWKTSVEDGCLVWTSRVGAITVTEKVVR
jgi:hypothetical protein